MNDTHILNWPLQVINTYSGEKELFAPQGDMVTLYVCGVTPYDYAHMGHARCYVNFDCIVRMLLFWGYSVTYVRNSTDIDDKIIKKALDACGDQEVTQAAVAAIARHYNAAFCADMAALNTLSPTIEPTVTDNISAIIDFIEQLIAQGHAYVAGNDVYFARDTYAEYGQLSGRVLDELADGVRIDKNELKKSAGDFVLWKGNVPGSFWDSPWGKGRPGWHIECSVLARKYAGDYIDIHGGGIDLLFPHHENEKAQSECVLQHQFVRYWLHNAHVMLKSEKMSKSLGNVFTVRDILAEYDPMVVRFYLLQHHYRTPLDIDRVHIVSAARAYSKLMKLYNPEALPAEMVSSQHIQHMWKACAEECEAAAAVITALADDCNIPKVLGILFGSSDQLVASDHRRHAVRLLLQHVLGLTLQPLNAVAVVVSDDIAALIAQRDQARREKDWKRADELRAELQARGHTVVDTKLSR